MSAESQGPGSRIEGTLYLEIGARLSLDPTELMEQYTGRLILSADYRDYLVGKTRYWVIRTEAMLNRGVDPIFMLDGEDTDTADFCVLFSHQQEDWSEAVFKACPEALFGDLTIVDRLIVHPPFRGKKVGLHYLEMMTRIIGGMGLFALHPVPLQYNEAYANDPNVERKATNKRADLKRLMKYYEQAGFRKVPGTDLMALNPRMRNPVAPWEEEPGDVTFEWTEAMDTYWLPKGTVEELS